MVTDKTKIDSPDNPLDDKTRVYGGTGSGDLGKTRIHHDDADAHPDFSAVPGSQGRKLAGWLVSYTLDPLGADFRLYEGRNIIGSDAQCDIVINGDPSVSGKHLTILFRMGVFKFKDELSTNGTFINEVFSEEGNLNDGDVIRIGNTAMKFRTTA